MMVDLIAEKSFTYNRIRLQKGDRFQATSRDAKVLADYYKKARRVTAEETQSIASGAEGRRQTYRRRDMRSAPAAEVEGGEYQTKEMPPRQTEAGPREEGPHRHEQGTEVPQAENIEGLTRKQLYDLATAEGIELNAADLKPAMIEKIMQARAAKS